MYLVRIIVFVITFFTYFIVEAGECKIIVGSSEYPPLTYSDPVNNVIGLDVELLNIIAKQAQCQVTWAPITTWEKVVAGLRDGTYTITTSASNTVERSQFAKFIPYRPDSTKVFVRKNDLNNFNNIYSFEDLLKRTKVTIGIYNGYAYSSKFMNLYKDRRFRGRFISAYDTDISINFWKLRNKEIDAVILESIVGINLINNSNFKDIAMLDLEVEDASGLISNLMISNAADPQGIYYSILSNAAAIVQNSDEYKQLLNDYYTIKSN